MVAAVPFLLGFFAIGSAAGLLSLVAGSVLLSANNGPGVALVQAMLPRNLGMALGLINGVAFGLGSALVTGVGVIVARYGPGSALTLVSLVPFVSALSFGIVRLRRQDVRAPAYRVGRSVS